MSAVFMLVKFFSEEGHATQFVDGKIRCNTVRTFKKWEESDVSGRSDRNEGTSAWLQPGLVQVVINGMDFSGDLAEPMQIQMDWIDDLYLFCMHAVHTGDLDTTTLSNENIEELRQEMSIQEACFEFGDYAVVVTNVNEFVRRMRATAQANGYRFDRNSVKYYDPETFHGSFDGIEAAFSKQRRQSYQREFRFVIDAGARGDCPLTLEIGDLSDITMPVRSGELNGPKLLGGDLKLPE